MIRYNLKCHNNHEFSSWFSDSKEFDRLKVKSSFIDGLRVTDKETMDIVEMVLSGSINKEIVMEINKEGGRAIGLSGKDALLAQTKRFKKKNSSGEVEKYLDLGFVGLPSKINSDFLKWCIQTDFIPVLSPIGFGKNFETYNINADTAAGAIAAALRATRMLMLTDVSGVLDKNGKLIPALTVSEAESLIKDGTVKGGMIPKVETCVDAVRGGAEAAVIMDGRAPHALLVELFTEHGIGTMIKADEELS